jgi:NADPH:quinone reductase
MSIATTPAVGPVEIPASMLAWQATSTGEPADVLHLAEVAVPAPGPGQLLVDVWSAGLNFSDALLTRGTFPGRPAGPFTPGLELCGEVVAVGEGVSRSRLGERVIGTTALPYGSLARFALAEGAELFPAPNQLDDTSASVFHLAYQTGWFGLYRRAGLRVGDTLLVHAAAGGLGSAAVQLGRAAGARVVAVVGDPEKVEVARRLGANVVLDRSTGSFEDLVSAVRDATDGRGADVVYDPVGGPAFEVSRAVIAAEGRVVLVGTASGQVPALDAGHLLAGNYSVLGVSTSHYRRANPDLVARAHADLSSLAEAGALNPLVSQRLAFEDAPEGIARLAAGATVGRLAVSPP